MSGALDTWEGTLDAPALDALIALVPAGVLMGQRPGDFTLRPLPRALPGGATAWPSGRCFDERLEVRWWREDGATATRRSVLVLGALPEGWTPPEALRHRPLALLEQRPARFLCVGKYDKKAPAGVHRWWDSRHSRCFHYLDSAPAKIGAADPTSGRRGGRAAQQEALSERAYLVAVEYELDDGRVQHRLLGFEHAADGEAGDVEAAGPPMETGT